MDDPEPMRVGEPLGHAEQDRQRFHDRQAPAAAHFGVESRSLDVLHRQERRVALEAAVEHHHDVRMCELAGRAYFALEPPSHLLAHRRVLPVGFDGDDAVEERVVRLVDDSHRAAAQDFAKLVPP